MRSFPIGVLGSRRQLEVFFGDQPVPLGRAAVGLKMVAPAAAAAAEKSPVHHVRLSLVDKPMSRQLTSGNARRQQEEGGGSAAGSLVLGCLVSCLVRCALQ